MRFNILKCELGAILRLNVPYAFHKEDARENPLFYKKKKNKQRIHFISNGEGRELQAVQKRNHLN
jgi:hypothetical protein